MYMKRGGLVALIGITCIALLGIFWWLLKDVTLHVLEPTGNIAAQQRDLIWVTVGLGALIIIPVFTMLAVFGWKYSEKRNNPNYKPEWRSDARLETLWWGVPIVIIIILGVVTWNTSHSLDPYKSIDSSKKTLEVQVVALQWKWLFLYPQYNVASLNVLPIEKDRPVHFTLSADAPMSSFWIPTLGTQIYAMNGMNSQLNLIGNKTGDFYGYNTNINGEGYASMRFNVKVREKDEFEKIMKDAQDSPAAMDEVAYVLLSKPEIEKNAYYYRLTQEDLYEQIVMKYMHGNMPAASMHDGIDHSTHSIEGHGQN